MPTGRNIIFWMQCYRCGAPTPSHEITRRVAMTGMQTLSRFGIPHDRAKFYQLVDLCLTCEGQEVEAERQRRRRLGAAIGGVGVTLFMWSVTGALPALSLGVLFFFALMPHRKLQQQLVILSRKES